MSEQLSLTGFDDPKRPTDRLFLTIRPDGDTAARIEGLVQRLSREHRLQGPSVAADRLHVTLHHLGDYLGVPRGVVVAAREAAEAIAMPPCKVSFDRVVSFSGKQDNIPKRRQDGWPLVLRGGDDVVEVTALQQALGTAMKRAGLKRWVASQFTPHLTLLYDNNCVVEQMVETITWTAHEFVLVHSLLGKGVHIPLGRWPLRG